MQALYHTAAVLSASGRAAGLAYRVYDAATALQQQQQQQQALKNQQKQQRKRAKALAKVNTAAAHATSVADAHAEAIVHGLTDSGFNVASDVVTMPAQVMALAQALLPLAAPLWRQYSTAPVQYNLNATTAIGEHNGGHAMGKGVDGTSEHAVMARFPPTDPRFAARGHYLARLTHPASAHMLTTLTSQNQSWEELVAHRARSPFAAPMARALAVAARVVAANLALLTSTASTTTEISLRLQRNRSGSRVAQRYGVVPSLSAVPDGLGAPLRAPLPFSLRLSLPTPSPCSPLNPVTPQPLSFYHPLSRQPDWLDLTRALRLRRRALTRLATSSSPLMTLMYVYHRGALSAKWAPVFAELGVGARGLELTLLTASATLRDAEARARAAEVAVRRATAALAAGASLTATRLRRTQNALADTLSQLQPALVARERVRASHLLTVITLAEGATQVVLPNTPRDGAPSPFVLDLCVGARRDRSAEAAAIASGVVAGAAGTAPAAAAALAGTSVSASAEALAAAGGGPTAAVRIDFNPALAAGVPSAAAGAFAALAGEATAAVGAEYAIALSRAGERLCPLVSAASAASAAAVGVTAAAVAAVSVPSNTTRVVLTGESVRAVACAVAGELMRAQPQIAASVTDVIGAISAQSAVSANAKSMGDVLNTGAGADVVAQAEAEALRTQWSVSVLALDS